MDSTGDIRLNPSQNAINTIISSKNNANLLTIDGVNDRVGINKAVPDEKLHVAGNLKIDGIFRGSVENVTHLPSTPVLSQPISVLFETSALDVYGASTYTLGDGWEGQTKFIYVSLLSSGGTATISATHSLGFSTIAFDAEGNGVTLLFVNGKWICVGNNGATLT